MNQYTNIERKKIGMTNFEMLEPMKYYSNDNVNNQKRQDMIENKNGEYVASCKKDGDWSLLLHYGKNKNLIRSRSISKVTGVYGDYTEKLPHLCEVMNSLPDNTVLLAEICWDEPNTNANTVGTILRCLPQKAVERQKNKKLKAVVFDILMLDGVELMDKPYIDRLNSAEKLLSSIKNDYIYLTSIYYDNFAEEADKIISNGGEGLVIQRKDNPYMPGTRTAWKTLKLKQSLPHLDLKVVGTIEPNKYYDGSNEAWPYIIDGKPVTKPYYMSWKNGIVVQLPSSITTDITSGLTDDDRAYLATEEAEQKIQCGELWAEVKAMDFSDHGRLRHGSLVRLRTDLNSEGE